MKLRCGAYNGTFIPGRMAHTPKPAKLPPKCRRCGKRGDVYCLIEGSPVARVVIGCKGCGHEHVAKFPVIETTGEVVADSGRAA